MLLIRQSREKGEDLVEGITRSRDSLKFFYTACESQSIKLAGIALNILQKLITSRAICQPHENVPKIVDFCGNFVHAGTDLQLKILQTLLLLFTDFPFEMQTTSVAKAFEMSFQLANQNNPIIKNTAGATLKQLAGLLFEKVVKEGETSFDGHLAGERRAIAVSTSIETVLVTLRPAAKDAYLVFHDFCALVRHDPPYWLAIEGISKMLGLDLMESVLSTNPSVFIQFPEFLNLMKDKVCPIALYFTDKTSFAPSMRTSRLVWVLVRDFHLVLPMECEIFMSMLIKLLEAENLLWQRALAAEVSKLICVEETVFYSLFTHFDMEIDAPKIVSNMIRGMAQYMKNTVIEKKKHHKVDASQKMTDLSASTFVLTESLSLKVPCLEQFDKVDQPPSLSELYPPWLILQSVFCVGDQLLAQLAVLFFQKAGTKTLRNINLEHHEKKEDIRMFLRIVDCLWASILIILSEAFILGVDENVLRDLFKAYLTWARVCGILEMTAARDAILMEICHLGIRGTETDKPGGDKGNVMLTRTNLLALRCLLNAASVLSEVLDSIWTPILETLLVVDRLSESFSGHRKQSTQLMIVSSRDQLASENEILLFRQSLNKLFENVQFFDNQAFFHFLKALCNMTLEDADINPEAIPIHGKKKVAKVSWISEPFLGGFVKCFHALNIGPNVHTFRYESPKGLLLIKFGSLAL